MPGTSRSLRCFWASHGNFSEIVKAPSSSYFRAAAEWRRVYTETRFLTHRNSFKFCSRRSSPSALHKTATPATPPIAGYINNASHFSPFLFPFGFLVLAHRRPCRWCHPQTTITGRKSQFDCHLLGSPSTEYSRQYIVNISAFIVSWSRSKWCHPPKLIPKLLAWKKRKLFTS